LADLKAKKEVVGSTTTDQGGVIQRKLKRKDVNAKNDGGMEEAAVDTDPPETLGDGVKFLQTESPRAKKMKARKGPDAGTGRGGKDAGTSQVPLNAQVLTLIAV
jgi:hypothetical protein